MYKKSDLKLAEKYAKIEEGFISPLSAEEIIPITGEKGFLELKKTGEVIIDLSSYVTKINDEVIVFEDELFINHIGLAIRLSDDYISIRLNEIYAELREVVTKKRKVSVKKAKLLKAEKESLLGYRGIVFRTVGLLNMVTKLGIDISESEENLLTFTDKLTQLVVTESYTVSAQLAEERGSCRDWDFKVIEADESLSTLFNTGTNSLMTEEVLIQVAKTGLRNNINFLIQ